MSRNAQSRFAINPTNIDISRSRFKRPFDHKTSFNVGQIVPFYIDEVLPGDTAAVQTSRVIRMPSLLTPVMDDLFVDMYYFFIPARLCWTHWKNFMGENTESAWLPKTEYSVPQITSPATTGWQTGTIADYLGIPVGVPNLSVSALPFRAYALVVNEWFRDENLCDPLNIPIGDSTQTGTNGDTFVSDVANGGMPYIAAKYHDYFTSALPAPQKGESVQIPGGTGANVPVYALDVNTPDWASKDAVNYGILTNGTGSWRTGVLSPGSEFSSNVAGSVGTPFAASASVSSDVEGLSVAPINLWAVGDSSLATATINQLRLAFQVQKLLEKDARSGTRYIEVLKGHFGVTSPDARLQRPEYLGGNRIPVNVNQIVQQSATAAEGTPQGTPVGLSLTTDTHFDFKKSFVEHGFILGVIVARYRHTYQQGIERFWSRKSRLDYYWPVFANIGEQAILNKEIFAQGTAEDDEVFGYQEAWADYRYKPNRISGEMRSQYAQSLDIWHYGDDYDTLPALSAEWIAEDPANVNRTIAVSDQNSNQFWADIYVENTTTRPMPMYSIPGLIDHH